MGLYSVSQLAVTKRSLFVNEIHCFIITVKEIEWLTIDHLLKTHGSLVIFSSSSLSIAELLQTSSVMICMHCICVICFLFYFLFYFDSLVSFCVINTLLPVFLPFLVPMTFTCVSEAVLPLIVFTCVRLASVAVTQSRLCILPGAVMS